MHPNAVLDDFKGNFELIMLSWLGFICKIIPCSILSEVNSYKDDLPGLLFHSSSKCPIKELLFRCSIGLLQNFFGYFQFGKNDCKHPKIKDFDKNLKSRIAKTVIKIEFKQKIVSVYCSSMFVHV